MLNKIRQISFSRLWKYRQIRDVEENSSNLIFATLKKNRKIKDSHYLAKMKTKFNELFVFFFNFNDFF